MVKTPRGIELSFSNSCPFSLGGNIFRENWFTELKKYIKSEHFDIVFCSTFACTLGKNRRVIKHRNCTRVCHYYYQSSLQSQWDD